MTDVLLVAGKLNNRQKAQRLGKMQPSDNPMLSALVSARNLDIDNNGAVTLRDGRELKLSGLPHSLWIHPKDDSIAYFVDDSILKKLNADFSSTVVTTLNSNAKLAYELINMELVISNGTDIGWLKETTYDAFAPSCEQFEVPISAGQYLAFHKGCLYVANGSVLEVSKPHDVERRDERYSLFPMAARIGMLGSVDDGLWISHKEVGFISGVGVDGLDYNHVTDATPPDGCFSIVVEESKEDTKTFILWASEEGFCKGGSGESYTNESFEDINLPEGEFGSFFHRFKDGIRQYIAVIHKPEMKRNYTGPELDITESTI
jgi:hypothetical protein